MKLVTADRRPDGIAARSSHRSRRRQSMGPAIASALGAETATSEPAGASSVDATPGSSGSAAGCRSGRARSAGTTRVAATASMTTSAA